VRDGEPRPDLLAARARQHQQLRFAFGLTAAFVLCEALQWSPSYLAPLLVVLLLVRLPACPPLAVGVSLVALNVIFAALTLTQSLALTRMPVVLLGSVALVLGFGFHLIAAGKRMPGVLLLLYAVIVPVVGLETPGAAALIAFALIRAFVIAILAVWIAYRIWPATPFTPPATATTEPAPRPGRAALEGTAVLLPIVALFMLFEQSHAVVVLVMCVTIVSRLEEEASRRQARALLAGNVAGGVGGILLFVALAANPSLLTLTGLLVLAGLFFSDRVRAGGDAGEAAYAACITMLIILGAGLSEQETLSSWVIRLSYLFLAAGFSVGATRVVRAWSQHAEGGPATAESHS